MNVLHRKSVLMAAAMVLALTCGANQAAKAAAQKPSTSKTPFGTSAASEVQTLRQAYSLLSSADHDYEGHRARAMKHIEAACRLLGSSIKGDGDADEPQNQSDSQVQQSQTLLQGAHATIAANNPRAGKHIAHAIQELTTALSVQ